MEDLNYLWSFIVIYGIIMVRYSIVALAFYLIYYKLFRKKFERKKIQLKFPKDKDYLREVKYSLMAICFFGFAGVLVLRSPISQFNQVYFDFYEMPLWYFFACFPIMILIHDTYFYWMHRAIHHKKIYKRVHLVHHKSTNPSPWAAYAFHPIEAILEAAILPILAFVMPLHISAFGIFFLFSIMYNVYGHSGFELYPRNFHKHWIGKYINTSVHHNLHHKEFNNSYGLYFTFWDRAMGTMAEKYDSAFEEVASRVY